MHDEVTESRPINRSFEMVEQFPIFGNNLNKLKFCSGKKLRAD
jgi:hypothetical protein